jgi:hypothetical protein
VGHEQRIPLRRLAAPNDRFTPEFGGYLVSTDFTIDAKRHAVISLPASARKGDLLSIRPLRLNNNEYLVLQKCDPNDCSEAQVVRAWNALGYMGPYAVLSNKIPIEPGAKYLLWMQHISTQGSYSFSLYDRDSPPLVFKPVGTPLLFQASDMEGARLRGPTPIKSSSTDGGTFIATFDGGSVVKMKLLRAKSRSAASLAPQ